MPFTSDTALDDLAARYPGILPVLHRLALPFCCGSSSLAGICRQRGIDYDQLAAALRARVSLAAGRGWDGRPATDLTAHITESFHDVLRAGLARLSEIARDVTGSHDSSHPVARLEPELRRVREHIDAHIATAERLLFPLIERLESGKASASDVDDLSRSRQTIEREHEQASEALEAIRHITNDYCPPARACHAVQVLYRELPELERLARLHTHLEIHELFPRAAAMVTAALLRGRHEHS